MIESVVRDDILPIYVNMSGKNKDAGNITNSVMCYNYNNEADYWCVRPVLMGRNKKVVTYLDEEWELRRSVVRVNENDTVLQAKPSGNKLSITIFSEKGIWNSERLLS